MSRRMRVVAVPFIGRIEIICFHLKAALDILVLTASKTPRTSQRSRVLRSCGPTFGAAASPNALRFSPFILTLPSEFQTDKFPP